MSRVARIVVPGFPHHVTQRGNRRTDIFEVDKDREAYLRFLRQYSAKRGRRDSRTTRGFTRPVPGRYTRARLREAGYERTGTQ